MAVVYHCLVAVFLLAVARGQIQPAPAGPVPEKSALLAIASIYARADPLLCKLCEEVIDFAKNVTENKEVLAGLVKIGEELCQLAPEVFYDECIHYVELIPEIIKAYANEYLDPQKDCAHVCKDKNPPMVLDSNMVSNVMGMLKSSKKPFN